MSVRPPGGTPPPTVVDFGEEAFDLVGPASEICERYYVHYADEHERYGPAGADWCRHDNQWLLYWAAGDTLDVVDLEEQVTWLARVLHSREFPLDRLAHNLRIAAEVAEERLPQKSGPAIGAALRRAGKTVDSLELG